MDKPALQDRDEDKGQVLYFTTHLYTDEFDRCRV